MWREVLSANQGQAPYRALSVNHGKGHAVLSRSSKFSAEMGRLSVKGHSVPVMTAQLFRRRGKQRRGGLSMRGCVP